MSRTSSSCLNHTSPLSASASILYVYWSRFSSIRCVFSSRSTKVLKDASLDANISDRCSTSASSVLSLANFTRYTSQYASTTRHTRSTMLCCISVSISDSRENVCGRRESAMRLKIIILRTVCLFVFLFVSA